MKLTLLLSLLFAFNLCAEIIYKTIPGTAIRDYSEMPGFVIE